MFRALLIERQKEDTDRIFRLKMRSEMLRKARSFFYDRQIVEVDCPLITSGASVDLHIDLIPTHHFSEMRYLHSSPEYGMKRLLAEGIGDIYQMSHVFRQEELGARHNPEFMLAEWYRLGFSLEKMILESVEFCRLFLGEIPCKIYSYREVFLLYAGIDPFVASDADVAKCILTMGLPAYENLEQEGRDAMLNLILALAIEPHLGKGKIAVLMHYPASQAALAQVRHVDGVAVAERFEIYFEGVELANGYRELTDRAEQEARLIASNRERVAAGKSPLPIDYHFLNALERGIPDCSGVAVGVDRLMMLCLGQVHIREVIPFCWDTA